MAVERFVSPQAYVDGRIGQVFLPPNSAEQPTFLIPKHHLSIAFHTGIEPSEEAEAVISGIVDFAGRVSNRIRERMSFWTGRNKNMPHIEMPRLAIYDAVAAEDFLKALPCPKKNCSHDACPQQAEIDDDGFLMGFTLPQSIRGRAYQGIQSIFWDELERKENPFGFKRIGKPGEHYEQVYYLFQIWPTMSQSEPTTIFTFPFDPDTQGRAS